MSTRLDPKIATFEVNEVYFSFSETEKDEHGEPKRLKTKRPLEITACGQKGFNYPVEDAIDKFNIDRLTCLKKKDYILQGDFFSDEFKYLEILLRKCTGPTCKSQAEIAKVIDNLDMTFIVVNAYLDFTDYEDPVKHYIDDLHFFHLESSRHKKATIFVMKGEVDLADTLLQVG